MRELFQPTSNNSENTRFTIDYEKLRELTNTSIKTVDINLLVGLTKLYKDEDKANKSQLFDNGLPKECWFLIILTLKEKSLFFLSQSCKTFYNLIFSSQEILDKFSSARLKVNIRKISEIANQKTNKILQNCHHDSLFQPAIHPVFNLITPNHQQVMLNKDEELENPEEKGFILRKT